MLYNKRQHIQHTTPRPLIVKPVGGTLSRIEWEKFSKKYLVPEKLHHFCERSGSGSLVFFGESGVDGAAILQQKYPERFHFILDCQDKDTAIIGLALSQETGLKVFEVVYKDDNKQIHNINDPQDLTDLTKEGEQIIRVKNVKLA